MVKILLYGIINIWVSDVQCLNSQNINIFKYREHLDSSFHGIRNNVHFHYNGTNANEINVLTTLGILSQYINSQLT